MEKFEINGAKGPEIFSGFVTKAKSVFTALIENVKANIKEYETKIEDTAKEISDNEISREKCEHEITKMEGKIDTIKDAIENVESTYKKIADAYSSTSKGETKELYSNIIDGARANCEKDVEKNRSEIARLNSDIEAIKNNIAEFTKIIDELNKDLENYNTELFRFTKAEEYLDKLYESTTGDLEEISIKKDSTTKKDTKTSKKGRPAKPKVSIETVLKEMEDDTSDEDGASKEMRPVSEEARPSVLDTFETETFKTKEEPIKKSEPEVVTTDNKISFEESLKQIYDLTGYKPNEEKETKKEEPIFTDNLENLFATPTVEPETPKKEVANSILGNEFSDWESILNAPDEEIKPIESTQSKSIVDGMDDTANQLLNPYGTTLAKLKSLVADEIIYKNGDKVPFVLTSEDIIKAVNAVDGNDLKKMKTVGPEITLLRKVKEMKEGNR